MTMFENRQLCGGGGYGGEGFGVMRRGSYGFSGGVGSDLMAEDDDHELRTDSQNDVAEESSSKDEGWLQLSIGGHAKRDLEPGQDPRKNNGSGLVELELMPSNSHSPSLGLGPEFRPPRPVTNFPGYRPAFYNLQHHGIGSSSSSFHNHNQEINWAFRPVPIGVPASSSTSLIGSGSYFPRPFQMYDVAAAGPAGVDFRVIQPPRRPHSGVWFMLQASQNQEKEPFLPQISKSYLRIKDGKMTIRLVIKYLVNKLSLENESEIEIRCKGQRLLPFLTLQHVRDNIWSSPRDFITLLPNSSTTHHIMVLHYARTTSSSSN